MRSREFKDNMAACIEQPYFFYLMWADELHKRKYKNYRKCHLSGWYDTRKIKLSFGSFIPAFNVDHVNSPKISSSRLVQKPHDSDLTNIAHIYEPIRQNKSFLNDITIMNWQPIVINVITPTELREDGSKWGNTNSHHNMPIWKPIILVFNHVKSCRVRSYLVWLGKIL